MATFITDVADHRSIEDGPGVWPTQRQKCVEEAMEGLHLGFGQRSSNYDVPHREADEAAGSYKLSCNLVASPFARPLSNTTLSWYEINVIILLIYYIHVLHALALPQKKEVLSAMVLSEGHSFIYGNLAEKTKKYHNKT